MATHHEAGAMGHQTEATALHGVEAGTDLQGHTMDEVEADMGPLPQVLMVAEEVGTDHRQPA